MTQRWIKVPRPGEFRGQGQWKRIEETQWRWDDPLIATGVYLPIHEGDEPPGDPGPDDMDRLAKACGFDNIDEMTAAAKAYIASKKADD